MLSRDDVDIEQLLEEYSEGREPGVTDYCEDCEDETSHYAMVKMVREAHTDSSINPHRFSKCDDCGYTNHMRMNRK